jgi:threonyl-tRNA synthetase
VKKKFYFTVCIIQCIVHLMTVECSFQIRQEILAALNFLKHVYSVFGFSFQLVLSTRPEKFLGEMVMWNEAEKVIYCFRNSAVFSMKLKR